MKSKNNFQSNSPLGGAWAVALGEGGGGVIPASRIARDALPHKGLQVMPTRKPEHVH